MGSLESISNSLITTGRIALVAGMIGIPSPSLSRAPEQAYLDSRPVSTLNKSPITDKDERFLHNLIDYIQSKGPLRQDILYFQQEPIYVGMNYSIAGEGCANVLALYEVMKAKDGQISKSMPLLSPPQTITIDNRKNIFPIDGGLVVYDLNREKSQYEKIRIVVLSPVDAESSKRNCALPNHR